MSHWPASKARRVLAALMRIGWTIKRQAGGSHKVLERVGWPDYVFAFHDDAEIGPKMLSRIGKHTGLQPYDLWLSRPGEARSTANRDLVNRSHYHGGSHGGGSD